MGVRLGREEREEEGTVSPRRSSAVRADDRADIGVGLSHNQTNVFPTLAVTAKELDFRGRSYR